jgi:hypothetical protein
MKKLSLILIMFLFTVFVSFNACKKNKAPDKISACGVENALTDLEWLRNSIRVFVENAENGHKVRIYQCAYNDNQTCFLVEPCSGCPDAGYTYVLCDGTVLCSGGTLLGSNTCVGLNIRNEKLIYQLN